ncbi:MAG: 23S rRNA (adenine(2030)-N(6))-methyltransferase RlmJ [Hyphomicrobium sp.]
MNYRHAYHAGNFADVVKHAVLALVIDHLKKKPAPFRVIDTHAGIGLYDLTGDEASRTGEWQSGIGRVLGSSPPPGVSALLEGYLDSVRTTNGGAAPLVRYPGSPLVARHLLRPDDRLIVNELHPDDHAALSRLFAGDRQTKVMALDGWTALKSLLPPTERRGLVLVDPPFEQAGEFERLVAGLTAAHRRFATGTMLLWYPVKQDTAVAPFHRSLAKLGLAKLLVAEVFVRRADDGERLNGSGLIVLNPPFVLHQQLSALLPWLAETLSAGRAATHRLFWL